MSYAPRAPPATFDEFLSALAAAHADGGVVVDEGIYDEFFGGDEGSGARAAFIASLPRPKSTTATTAETESCPVCLQSIAAILTEEEYALASEHYFGDVDALGVRELPCEGRHVVCARCAGAWLRINNTCPMCRAPMDPEAPVPVDAIENQRHTERMLALFHALFGRGAGGGAAGDEARGAGDSAAKPKEEDRSAFAGMYS